MQTIVNFTVNGTLIFKAEIIVIPRVGEEVVLPGREDSLTVERVIHVIEEELSAVEVQLK